MSAEVAIKKRGRPKKIVARVEVEVEEIDETPKKTTTRKTTRPTTAAKKTSAAKKGVKIEKIKSSLPPQKSKGPILEAVEKLEVSNVSNTKVNPTSKSVESTTLSDYSSSSFATATPKEYVKPSPALRKPQTVEIPSSPAVANPPALNSKILNEVQALSKQASPANRIEDTAKETTTGDEGTQATIERAAITDTPLKEAPISTKSIPNTQEPTMAKPKEDQPLPFKSTSSTINPQAEAKPKIPITALNSRIVSEISGRAGARIGPAAGGAGKLPSNYKPIARKITRTIIALPILLVTSYLLYERLALGEEQKKLIPMPKALTGTKAEEGSKELKPTSNTN